MGQWTVLKRYGHLLAGPGHAHDGNEFCDKFTTSCGYIVEEHQHFTATPEPPEFTIAVSHQRGTNPWVKVSDTPGWKWSICWTDKNERRKMCTGYGFTTQALAKAAAEAKATEIAEHETAEEEVYRFTPKV